MMTKLFCFPYAGGSSMIYSKWKPVLHPMIQLRPLEMAGRGMRFGSSLSNSIEDVTNDFFKLIAKDLDSHEYALWGHSMGTLIVYELMGKIMHAGYKNPKHLFLSGRFPPPIKEKQDTHQLPDELFKLEIIKLGDLPKELVDDKEFFDFFLPILRADYTIIDTYQYEINERGILIYLF